MPSDPPSPTEESKPLPKATMPVQLAPLPSSPSGGTAPAEESAEVAEPAELPEATEAPATEKILPEPKKPRGLVNWVRSLSFVEKLCCGGMLLGVVVFTAFVFVPALFDFADQPELLVSADFPVKGTDLEVKSAESYWREPTLEGPDAETVRAGTVLIPVLNLQLSGKGDVRVLFRDGEGKVVGDPVSLALSGNMDFSAASTVGFNQRGDFAAYQTGEIEPWIAEFHEVPSDAEGLSEDTLLFKMIISPILK